MSDGERTQYFRQAFQRLRSTPLDFADPEQRQLYVSIYEREGMRDIDPVHKMFQTIHWSEGESATLLSGYRGTGKSTELRRLKQQLENDLDALVFYCDMRDYINMDAPPDVPDLLLSLAGAFADKLESVVPGTVPKEGYWDRMVAFLKRTNVTLDEVSLSSAATGASLRMALKSSPTFQQRLQQGLATHVGALAAEVRDWFATCVTALHREHEAAPVVILYDSLEQIRGVGRNVAEVAEHLVAAFTRVEYLRIPDVHVVYTVPPWMKARHSSLADLYDDFIVLPCVKVCSQPRSDEEPGRRDVHEVFLPGVEALQEVARKRFDWTRLLSQPQMDRLCAVSGGYFRDYFRLLQACLRAADRQGSLPLEGVGVTQAIAEVRQSYLPLSTSDAEWLARIDHSGSAHLPELGRLGDLARFFDGHLVLTYLNGHEWYRAHPIIAEEVHRIAAAEARAGDD